MDYFCHPAEFTSSSSPQSSSAVAVISYNGRAPMSGVFESSTVKFQPNLHGVSMDWSPGDEAILEEGLVKYASEPNIVSYAKIAVHLDNKTIRDVALRCRWMSRKYFSKKRKEDFILTRKNKERKEKVPDPSPMSSHAVIQSGLPSYAQGLVPSNNSDGDPYNVIGGLAWQLLGQNAQAFEQIVQNLATHQVHENIGLLCHARDNILHIVNNLTDPPNGKQMPPLPVKVNEQLANSILPISTFRMQ